MTKIGTFAQKQTIDFSIILLRRMSFHSENKETDRFPKCNLMIATL